MTRLQVAVLGFGRLGLACADAVLTSEDLSLAGIVRRGERVSAPLPEHLQGTKVATHWSEMPRFDVALLCLPPGLIGSTSHELLQHRMPIVECTQLDEHAYEQHKAKIHRIAYRQHTPAIVGAGWDPGALSIFGEFFQLLTPKGNTETSNRPGVHFYHSAWVRDLAGVKDALCTEFRSSDGKTQRYVYVEPERNADAAAVMDRIRADPLFLNAETHVLTVDSISALEDEGHGVVMERRGTAGRKGHQFLLFEARFDRWALAAQVMVAAARAIPGRRPGAYALTDIPPSALQSMTTQLARVGTLRRTH